MVAKLLIYMIMLGLLACANNSTLVIGPVSDAVKSREVEIYYANNPACEYVVVALMEIPGHHYSRASLIEAFRVKAASLGATAIQISHMQKIGASEYLGSARAIRCVGA